MFKNHFGYLYKSTAGLSFYLTKKKKKRGVSFLVIFSFSLAASLISRVLPSFPDNFFSGDSNFSQLLISCHLVFCFHTKSLCPLLTFPLFYSYSDQFLANFVLVPLWKKTSDISLDHFTSSLRCCCTLAGTVDGTGLHSFAGAKLGFPPPS